MSQQNKSQDKSWSKPELTRLGQLADVGPRPNPGATQGSNARS
jgi:hypothetical protein